MPAKLSVLTHFPLWIPCAFCQGSKTIPPRSAYLSAPQHSCSSTMSPFRTTVNALSLPNTIPIPHTTTLHHQGDEPSSYSICPIPMSSSLPSFSAQSHFFLF